MLHSYKKEKERKISLCSFVSELTTRSCNFFFTLILLLLFYSYSFNGLQVFKRIISCCSRFSTLSSCAIFNLLFLFASFIKFLGSHCEYDFDKHFNPPWLDLTFLFPGGEWEGEKNDASNSVSLTMCVRFERCKFAYWGGEKGRVLLERRVGKERG